MDVNPTRMELLKLRDKKKLAEKGYSLLKNKQDALIVSFFAKVKEYSKKSFVAADLLKAAYEEILLAQVLDGVSNVKTAAMNYPSGFEISISNENIMGVKIKKINFNKINYNDFEYIGSSNQLLFAKKRFEKALVEVLKKAVLEETIIKLGEEIKKTKRRLNSLEHIKIPELVKAYGYVDLYLSELERENFFRLKLIKLRIDEAENLIKWMFVAIVISNILLFLGILIAIFVIAK